MLRETLLEKKLIVFLGAGGVGKTTLSAASGLFTSLEGRRTLVITVDPARKLADALGIELDIIKEVSDNLFAVQVDARADFDNFVREKVPAWLAKRLFDNRLYKVASELLPSWEYISAHKVEELVSKGDFDIVIVDTPPSLSAINFLEAPKRVLHITRSGAASKLIKAYSLALGSRRFVAPASLKAVAKIAGADFLFEFAEFMFSLKEIMTMIDGMAERALRLFRNRESAFIVVSAPEPILVSECLELTRRITRMGLNFRGFVINRYFHLDGRYEMGAESFFSKLAEFNRKTIDPLFRYDIEVLPEVFFEVNELEGLHRFVEITLRRRMVGLAREGYCDEKG